MTRLFAACLSVLLFAACGTAPSGVYTPVAARFFLESADDQGSLATLPQSGVRIVIAAKPVFTEFDLVKVEVAHAELGECLQFQLTPAAARDLYRLTAAHQGRRLVLVLNGEPLGAQRIERPWADGSIRIFVEQPDAALPGLAENLRKTAEALQQTAARN